MKGGSACSEGGKNPFLFHISDRNASSFEKNASDYASKAASVRLFTLEKNMMH